MDNEYLDPSQLEYLKRARETPLAFGELLLTCPTTNQPFKATYPQKFMLSSKKRDLWVCVHRRSGKCVVGDTLILNPETGEYLPIEDCKDLKYVLCFDFASNQTVKVPCTWIKSGVKKCLKLEFESGIGQGLSFDHEVFCSRRGWIRSEDLRIGDRILAPSKLEWYGTNSPEEHEIQVSVDYTFGFKEVPSDVFLYNKESLFKFIKEIFIHKGRILHIHNAIYFMFWSKNLSKDIKHLLLRLGIGSSIDEDGNLKITEVPDKSKFLNIINSEHIITEIRNDRNWETVVNIKSLGERPVFDLSVDHPDHNFIGNDLVLHNSYAMTITALWHAVTKPDQRIVVFAPSSIQINEFFDTMDKWINKNPILQALQASAGNHKTPQRRTFVNGSTIQGYLMGLAGSIEGAKKGITADIVFVDEAQLLDEDDWRVITPIMVGDKFRQGKIRSYITGTTPDNPSNYYYEKIYKTEPASFEERVFIPITENIEYTPDKVEEIRLTTPPNIWTTEYLLELGEADTSVFRKKDIYACCLDDWEYGPQNIDPNQVRFIGVDWDKTQAGTNIAVFQYDIQTRRISIIYREEVSRDRFTYLNACQTVIDLFNIYQPELVITDQGQGETQYELLQDFAERNNHPLATRLIKKAFNEKIETIDFQTGDMEKKMIKPFLVGLLQRKIQEGQFKFPTHDEKFCNQLLEYHVKTITVNTIKYSSKNEHIIDCCLLAIYGIWTLFENELETKLEGFQGVRTFQEDFKDTSVTEEILYNSVLGQRIVFPGNYMPRSSFDNPGKPTYEDFMNFFRD